MQTRWVEPHPLFSTGFDRNGVDSTPPHSFSMCLYTNGMCKGNPSRFHFHFRLPLPAHPLTLHLPPRPTTASNPPPASAVLACHVTGYLTRTYTYLPILVLLIISVTLYISPYLQEDSYPFLFGSPARYVSCLDYYVTEHLRIPC